MKRCNDCSAKLTGLNWATAQRRNFTYLCRPCKNRRDWKYKKGKPTKLQRLRGKVRYDMVADFTPPERTPMNWEYIAGFFDAEGSVSRVSGVRRYLNFTNTNLGVLKGIHSFLKCGRLYHRRPQEHQERDCYFIRVATKKDAMMVATMMMPYSRVKRASLSDLLINLNAEPPAERLLMSWSFIAGFFDGDGGFCKNVSGRRAIPVFGNKHGPIINEIRDVIGYGEVYEGLTEKGDPFYTLMIPAQDEALRLSKKMLPHLRINWQTAIQFIQRYDRFSPQRHSASLLEEGFEKKLYFWRLKGVNMNKIGASTWMDRSGLFGIMKRNGIQ